MLVFTARKGVTHIGDMKLTHSQVRRWMSLLQHEGGLGTSPLQSQAKQLLRELMDANQHAMAQQRNGGRFPDVAPAAGPAA